MQRKRKRMLSQLASLLLAGGLFCFPAGTTSIVPGTVAWAEEKTAVDLNQVRESEYRIETAGTYVLSGTYTGQIRIDTDKDDTVKLVLDGATIANKNDAAVYCVKADKLVISTEEGTNNSITVSGDFDQTDGNNTDGAIFSKDELILKGKGTLNIVSEKGHGIVSKDEIKIKGGTVNVTAGAKGISANEDIEMEDGTVTVVASDDGINSEEDIKIEQGVLTVSSGDDGMHADEDLVIEDGQITVKESYEGLEGLRVIIRGGTVDIKSSDDGINAAGGNDASGEQNRFGGEDPFRVTAGAGILISGGQVNIDAAGDGVDSNGTLKVTGGTLFISGPVGGGDSAIDYASSASVDGGTVAAAGSSTMAEGFNADSGQASLLYVFENEYDGGTELRLLDSNGNVMLSFTPAKKFSSVVISVEGLKENGTCTLTVGNDSYEIEMTGTVWSNKQGGFGPGFGFGPGSGGGPGAGGGNFGGPGRGDFNPGERFDKPEDSEFPDFSMNRSPMNQRQTEQTTEQ